MGVIVSCVLQLVPLVGPFNLETVSTSGGKDSPYANHSPEHTAQSMQCANAVHNRARIRSPTAPPHTPHVIPTHRWRKSDVLPSLLRSARAVDAQQCRRIDLKPSRIYRLSAFLTAAVSAIIDSPQRSRDPA